MLYKFCSRGLNLIFRLIFFLRIKGRENVPKEGGLLVCTNHLSNFDPPAIAASFPRSLRFMAKEELFHNPVFGKFITMLGAFPIRRGKGDVCAVMTAMKILNRGETTLIFPEGTRVHNGDSERKIDPGIIKLAIKSKVPILPGYTNGKYKLFGGLRVYFGKPIVYDKYYNTSPDSETLERLAHELMTAIYSFSEGCKA